MKGIDGRWKTRKFWWGVGLVAALVLVVSLAERYVMFTETVSLSHRFWVVLRPEVGYVPKAGDYVVFRKEHPYIVSVLKSEKKYRSPLYLTKMVRCLPGQVVSVKEGKEIFPDNGETAPREGRHYYCDGQYMGFAWNVDSKGREMPKFVYNGPVPEGTVFVGGHHPKSFDSRYFGLLSLEEIYKRAYAIF